MIAPFNPTMVRLLLVEWLHSNPSHLKLSIPQWCDCCVFSRNNQSLLELAFNPTMVRLLLVIVFEGDYEVLKPFNPTMVRLLPLKIVKMTLTVSCFQSHNGAIAARSSAERDISLLSVFQSHNGAIAATLLQQNTTAHRRLSIPQWCDCCPVVQDEPPTAKDLSIPQWCDCFLERSRQP